MKNIKKRISAKVSAEVFNCLSKNESKSVLETYIWLCGITQHYQSNDYGQVQIGHRFCSLSKPTVISAVNRLEELGYISVHRSHGRNKITGEQHSYGYTVLKNEAPYVDISTTVIYPIPARQVCDIVEQKEWALEATKSKKSIYTYVRVDLQRAAAELEPDDYMQLYIFSQSNKTPKRIDDRIYSPFHYLQKSLRKYCTLNGSPLVEAYDVHACGLLMVAKVLSLHAITETAHVDDYEINALIAQLATGDIYTDIARAINWQATDVATAQLRGEVKQTMQHWLNLTADKAGRAMNNHSKFGDPYYSKLDDYMYAKYPSIRIAILTYPNTTNKKNNVVKQLYWDLTKMEWETITDLASSLNRIGLCPLSVHDAIYITEAELAKVGTEQINKMFWISYQK